MEIRYVEWIDSAGGAGWVASAQSIVDMRPDKCRTVGFVLHETKDYIVFVQSLNEEDRFNDNRISIPKFAITHSKTLKKGGNPVGKANQ